MSNIDSNATPPRQPFSHLPSHDFTQLLGLFHPNRPWTLTAIGPESIKTVSFLPGPHQERDAAEWASKLNSQGCALYFSVNPLRQPLDRKAAKDDIASSEWLYIDLDPPSKLMLGADLEDWRARMLKELRTGGQLAIPPTLILDSGRGYWCFWRINKVTPLDGGRGKATAEYEARGRALESAFGADACRNIDRICRLPGFVNHRTGKVAVVVEHRGERVYPLTCFPPMRWAALDNGHLEPLPDALDDQSAVDRARAYLAEAPICVEGSGGHNTLIKVAHRLMDLGCRLPLALQMMLDTGWNDRCLPPWDIDEMEKHLGSLLGSRQAPIGRDTPEYRTKVEFKDFVEYPSAGAGEGVEEDADAAQARRDAEKSAKARQERAQHRFKLEPLGDVLNAFDEAQELWTVDRLFPQSGVCILYGKPKSYKSFVALHINLCVANGLPWAARETQQGSTVYIAAEASGGVRKRLAGYHKHHGDTYDRKAPFYLVAAAPNLGNQSEDIGELITAVSAVTKTPRIITIDTLAQTLHGGDENGSGMMMFVTNATLLANHFNCCVLVVHHVGLSDDTRMRGHSSLHGGVDLELRIERTKELLTSQIIVSKLKDEEDEVVFETKLIKVSVKNDEQGRPVTTLVPVLARELGAQQQEAQKSQDEVKKEADDRKHRDFLIAIADVGDRATQKGLMDKFGITRASVRWTVKAMIEEKLILEAAGFLKRTAKGKKVVEDERAAAVAADLRARGR
jgi:hypothetical protein